MSGNAEITVTPIAWHFRRVIPDGTDHPPFVGIVTGTPTGGGGIRLSGALGNWDGGIGALVRVLLGMGFSVVHMDRHGKSRTYSLHRWA